MAVPPVLSDLVERPERSQPERTGREDRHSKFPENPDNLLVEDGVMQEMWALLVGECEELGAVSWEWQAADAVMGKSRFSGGARGPNPTDRAKMGTKKSVLVEQHGGPLAVEIYGANVHDTKLLERTLEAVVIERPDSTEAVQNLCLDKGYDNPTGEAACAKAGYVPHIRRIGEEKQDGRGEHSHPARRWVVERTIAWLQKCRALLIRYDKKRRFCCFRG